MNPVMLVADLVANALRLVRNLLALLGPAPEFVVLTVSGSLPERRPPGRGIVSRLIPQLLPSTGQDSLEEWRERLRLLARDRRVRGIVLKVGDLQAGAAALESLRDALLRYRASGGRIVAHVPTADLPGYYLASAADQLIVPESAEIALHGPRNEITFLRLALDRLGILPQYHHIAEYKTASHRFLYPQMTDAQREMANALLDGYFSEVVSAIARARGLEEAVVRSAVDRGLHSGSELVAQRLADGVAFEDELPRLLGGERAARLLPWAQARSRLPAPYRWRGLERQAIGVVQLIGTIIPGESRELPIPVPLFGRYMAGHETVARAFRAAERLPAVKAVVFHVDSGGGSAIASDMIWREVDRLRRSKPVVVYMANVAGSGGYYVACGASYVVANATTITGSIGVVSGKFNARGLYERLGLRREIISRGATAGMSSAFTDFTEQEWAALRGWMEEIYVRFKTRVASGRRMDPSRVESLARGRVYTGRQALALGLIDELGDFQAAVHKARALAGIPAEAEVPVLTIRPPKVAAVPDASPAAWTDALRQLGRLLQDGALLLIPPDEGVAP